MTWTVTYSHTRHDFSCVNSTRNHNLEQMAQALYKSWFIDFEPFKGGKFVDSELGPIPEGWRVACLGEVTTEKRDKVGYNEQYKVLSPISEGKLVLSDELFSKQVYSESISKYFKVKPDEFAYNPARVNIGSIGMNEYSFIGCVSPVYVVFQCEKGYHNFFDCLRQTRRFKDEIVTRASGGVRQTLLYKDFAMIKLVYPPSDIVGKFNEIYEKLKSSEEKINNQSQEISDLRDLILPKLMSGELKINDFNK